MTTSRVSRVRRTPYRPAFELIDEKSGPTAVAGELKALEALGVDVRGEGQAWVELAIDHESNRIVACLAGIASVRIGKEDADPAVERKEEAELARKRAEAAEAAKPKPAPKAAPQAPKKTKAGAAGAL